MFWKSSLFLLLLPVIVEARVFDINSEKLASYLVFNMAMSGAPKAAFENEANTSYLYDKSVKYNMGSDFGILYATSFLNYRFGFEILKPDVLQKITASNGGTTVYQIDSQAVAYAPKLGVEINLRRENNNRSYAFGYMGTASLNVKNSYSGSTIAPLGAHSVEMSSSAQLIGYGIGQEGFMTDTTTYLFEVGYRQLNFNSLKYKSDVTTFSGSKTSGSKVVDVDGNAREINLGGYYLSLGFRIYMY